MSTTTDIAAACGLAVKLLEIVHHLGADSMLPSGSASDRARFAKAIEECIEACRKPSAAAVSSAAGALADIRSGVEAGRLLASAPAEVKDEFRCMLTSVGDVLIPVAASVAIH